MWIAKVNGSQVLGFDNVGEFDAAWLATQVTAGADDADIRDTRLDFLTCDGQCVIRKPQAEIDAILAAEADAKAAADEKQQDALEADKKAAEEARVAGLIETYGPAVTALVSTLAVFNVFFPCERSTIPGIVRDAVCVNPSLAGDGLVLANLAMELQHLTDREIYEIAVAKGLVVP